MLPASLEITKQFRSLFAGRTDAYGLRHGQVVRSAVTERTYARHLFRDHAIGIFPLRDDGTVSFCAIDLDRDDPDTAWQLAELLPGAAWVERTRSGHYHVWSFFDEPLAGWVARFIMRSALEAAGQENVEVFPKTDTLRPGMLGNYINLPYPSNARAKRQRMMGPNDQALDLFDFVASADAHLIETHTWRARAMTLGGRPPEAREDATPFGEQETLHECALYIIERARSGEAPLAEGHRSKVLFAVSKQLLNWKLNDVGAGLNLVKELNASGERPLPDSEVERIYGSALAGQYTSTSCDDPVVRPYCHPSCPIAHGSDR